MLIDPLFAFELLGGGERMYIQLLSTGSRESQIILRRKYPAAAQEADRRRKKNLRQNVIQHCFYSKKGNKIRHVSK